MWTRGLVVRRESSSLLLFACESRSLPTIIIRTQDKPLRNMSRGWTLGGISNYRHDRRGIFDWQPSTARISGYHIIMFPSSVLPKLPWRHVGFPSPTWTLNSRGREGGGEREGGHCLSGREGREKALGIRQSLCGKFDPPPMSPPRGYQRKDMYTELYIYICINSYTLHGTRLTLGARVSSLAAPGCYWGGNVNVRTPDILARRIVLRRSLAWSSCFRDVEPSDTRITSWKTRRIR